MGWDPLLYILYYFAISFRFAKMTCREWRNLCCSISKYPQPTCAPSPPHLFPHLRPKPFRIQGGRTLRAARWMNFQSLLPIRPEDVTNGPNWTPKNNSPWNLWFKTYIKPRLYHQYNTRIANNNNNNNNNNSNNRLLIWWNKAVSTLQSLEVFYFWAQVMRWAPSSIRARKSIEQAKRESRSFRPASSTPPKIWCQNHFKPEIKNVSKVLRKSTFFHLPCFNILFHHISILCISCIDISKTSFRFFFQTILTFGLPKLRRRNPHHPDLWAAFEICSFTSENRE